MTVFIIVCSLLIVWTSAFESALLAIPLSELSSVPNVFRPFVNRTTGEVYVWRLWMYVLILNACITLPVILYWCIQIAMI